MAKYFTSIGSRSTPPSILEKMEEICFNLCSAGWILRSGGAEGADSVSASGCLRAKGQMEIYLPWKGFNNIQSPYYEVCPEALKLASTIHPAWGKLSQGAQRLHARNCYQVLGYDLKTPSKFIICWTKNAGPIGGTRTAIVLGEQNKIPVYNLGDSKWDSLDFNKLKEESTNDT